MMERIYLNRTAATPLSRSADCHDAVSDKSIWKSVQPALFWAAGPCGCTAGTTTACSLPRRCSR